MVILNGLQWKKLENKHILVLSKNVGQNTLWVPVVC